MTTTFDIEAFFADRRRQINAALEDALPTVGRDGEDSGRVREGMRYAALAGGKRMRPLIVVAACEAAGGTTAHALPACCAVELVHAYSLVHDDLPAMDDDAERRGRPTVHVAFGQATAILVGDALLTRSFELLVRGAEHNPRSRMSQAVAKLAHHAGVDGMVGGQGLDLRHGQDIQDLVVLEHVHALKTGALYAASGAMGALCAGASDDIVEQLERFGLCFGIAFQHADDILDNEQPSLREQALHRVDTLVEQCLAISEAFVERGEALSAVAEWVRVRAHAARHGHKDE